MIWRSAVDHRVRPEHRVRNGKTFAWDSPPSDGHPGEPINCRCVALFVPDNEVVSQEERFEERLREGVHVGKVEGELSQTDINFILRGANRAGLTEFLAAHPLGKIAFKALESPYTVGEYDALTGVISLNVARASSTIGSTAKAGDVLGVSAWGKTRKEAMRINFVHELGHHVLRRHNTAFEVALKGYENPEGKRISRRSYENWQEYFCECLAAHTFFKARFATFDPAGAKMIEDLYSTLGR